MINAQGRYISGNITETGRYNSAIADETGVYGTGIPAKLHCNMSATLQYGINFHAEYSTINDLAGGGLSAVSASPVALCYSNVSSIPGIVQIGGLIASHIVKTGFANVVSISEATVISAGFSSALATSSKICSFCEKKHTAPSGMGVTKSASTILQHGLQFTTGFGTSNTIGGGGLSVKLTAPLRIAGGGNESVSTEMTIGFGGHNQIVTVPFRIAGGGNEPLLSNLALGFGGYNQIVTSPLRIAGGGNESVSAPLTIGLNGYNQVSTSPLRIAGGGNESISTTVSVDGGYHIGTVTQFMPLSLMSGMANISSPFALSNPITINAQYNVTILIDSKDVTRQISECTITSSESAIFDTISITIPDGSEWSLDNPPNQVTVIFPDTTHIFMIEEFAGNNVSRTIWGRPLSAIYAEPWSGTTVWNNRDTEATTANGLAYTIANADYTANDFPLPATWEVEGTPVEALSILAKAAGGIVTGDSQGDNLIIRKRWITRPVDMKQADIIINRDTAIDLSIDKNDIQQYSSVTVSGWSAYSNMPQFQIEGSPVLGESAYIRLYWKGESKVSEGWITSGTAAKLSGNLIAETLTETVVFTNGAANVEYPIWELVSVNWLGSTGGDVTWLENAYSNELAVSSPGYGVATITYKTKYERWILSKQAVETVIFGIDLSSDINSAIVTTTTGNGKSMGEVKEPLLPNTAACVIHGTALIDDNRIHYNVKATVPRLRHINLGSTAYIADELTGISGFGKVKGVETKITPTRMTQAVEVSLC